MLDNLASGVDRAFHAVALARGRRSRAMSLITILTILLCGGMVWAFRKR